MLKIEKPLLPFFSREKRFKPPTTPTAFNSSISYFTPSIKFKEDPELFLNGLIKNRNKEDKNIAGIFPTLEQIDEKRSQVDKLQKIMTVPEKNYYDGMAEIQTQTETPREQSLNALQMMTKNLERVEKFKKIMTVPKKENYQGTAKIEKARALSPTSLEQQALSARQLMTENLVRAGYTKPKQGKRPTTAPSLEVQISSLQDRPPTIEPSPPLVPKPPPKRVGGGGAVNPKKAKDMEALMEEQGEKGIKTFVFSARDRKLLREQLQSQNLGTNVTPKMMKEVEELSQRGLTPAQIIFELTRRQQERKGIKPTGRPKSSSALQIGGKAVGGGR
jgi:hypothetical protein